jgi:transcriptional regulator with XRE-family HTH domain
MAARDLTRLQHSATLCSRVSQTTENFSLSAARVNSGHTIRSLAAVVGIDYRTLRRLENGEEIHPGKAKRVADYFHVQVTDLMPVENASAA